MNICIFCNRASQLCPRNWFGVASGLVRDCLWIASGPVRLRVDYVSFTSRLRLVYVFDPYQTGKNGCGSAEYGTAKWQVRGFGSGS